MRNLHFKPHVKNNKKFKSVLRLASWLRQENGEIKAMLDYIMRAYLKMNSSK
jgi:hypothetical protein